MLRIGDALRDMVQGNPILQFGLQHRLLNLRSTAAYIKPLVEAKTRKQCTESSLTMALSRLQRAETKTLLSRSVYHFDRVMMHTRLATFTYAKSKETHAGVQKLHAFLQRSGGYMTVAEGTSQITMILDVEQAVHVERLLLQQPLYRNEHIASVSVSFGETYLNIPGLIYIVLQQLMLLNINIIEVSSTYTELSLYIDEADLKTAFDALEGLFYTKS